MDVYQYVASNDPNGAVSIINSFGYEVVSKGDLGRSLSELVSNVGEPALKKVLEFHPDKDIILEMFSNNNNEKQPKCEDCSLFKNKERSWMLEKNHFLSASGANEVIVGQQKGDTTTLAHQTNTILVVSALIIATALIVNKK